MQSVDYLQRWVNFSTKVFRNVGDSQSINTANVEANSKFRFPIVETSSVCNRDGGIIRNRELDWLNVALKTVGPVCLVFGDEPRCLVGDLLASRFLTLQAISFRPKKDER